MSIDLAHEIELSPTFHDLDPMNIVWHGNYVKYLEIARCALLSRFDYDYPQMYASGFVWPIVDMRLKYVKSAVFNQRLRIRAEIVEWENRLKIEYLISDADTGQRLNKAYTIQVAVCTESQEMQYLCPPVLWERLGVPTP
ncbi:acyl-CoA thioesterase [Chitinimonas viridis]|uniref:Acyl-CoA thioesterase n=1 Tax=Chitinimonas viridis TaxID=664880 RepID=A0ABT8B274_9NEIS|nr:acyl-CoA thioesterase [Chitinimonas viridis]MDN3576324.1 acyl-CoA thioesterase [Chitinimonas viridis]